MDTHRERILDYLRRNPEGADDDQLSDLLNIHPRQAVNQICRRLKSEGSLVRKRVGGKLRNSLAGPGALPIRAGEPILTSAKYPHSAEAGEFKEDEVKKDIKTFLEGKGYRVTDVAWGHTRGKDIVATRSGSTLWVTAKGYPQGTRRTRASTQANHYIKDAIFDVVAWRSESEVNSIAVALPDRPTYKQLAEKSHWLQRTAGFEFFWVESDGSVIVAPP